MQNQSTGALVKRLWRDYMKGYIRFIIPAAILLLLGGLTTGAQAWLIQPAIDKALIHGDDFYIYAAPIAILLVSSFKGFANYGQAVLMNKMGFRLIAQMQSDMMRSVLRADLARLYQDGTDQLVSRFVADSYVLRDAVVKSITGMVRDFVVLVFMVGLMFYQNWQLACLVFAVFPISVLPIVILGKKLRRVSKAQQERTASMLGLVADRLRGIKLVKSYCAEPHAQERSDDLFGRLAAIHLKAVEVRSRSYPIMETLGGIAVATLIIFGSIQVADGDATPGEIMSFLAALMFAYQPMRSIATLNASLQQGLAGATRVFEAIDIKPTIHERQGSKPLAVSDGAVSFENVDFAYGDRPVLQGLSLEVPAGSRVALVGPSGAGKTTIFNLLMRLYEPTSGTIRIDGQPINDVTVPSLRGAIALVSQEATIFNETVAANIAFAERDPDMERVHAAAEMAEADDFIRNLDDGYDTVLGEMGVKLSGGQRQRLAIARAIYKDAPILLLDEATSALDAETEKLIQQALERLMQGRTVLMIAHRLSTVVEADTIHVIEDGRLVESGTHDDLIANDHLYAKLYKVV
ncbi:MAG: ABC transporter ATP-binding protein [Alphaproteobacteria bacterium]